MSAAGGADREELEAHFRAYLQIFRAVLKKRSLPPDQEASALARVKAIAQDLARPDDYLERIPDFARELGVRQEALAQFIGANLLTALDAVQRQLREKRHAEASLPAAEPSAPAKSPAVPPQARGDLFLQELLNVCGTLMQQSDRFEELEMGALKLLRPAGEALSRYASELQGQAVAPAEAATADTAARSPAPQAKPGVAPLARTATPAPSVAPPPVEQSILQEVLDRFSRDLKAEGTLVPRDYAEESGAEESPTAPSDRPAARPTVQSVAARSPPQAEATVAVKEASILEQVIKLYGGVLTAQGRLAPQSGVPETSGEAPLLSDQSEADEDPSEVDEIDLEPIPFIFQEYLAVLRLLQEFQSKGDQDGYKRWFATLGEGARAQVGLRNLEARHRQSPLQWSSEYSNLAGRMGLEAGQVAELHQRLRRFQQMQQALNEFTVRIRSNPPPVVEALKRIWPQIRLLFNDDVWDAESMMSRLKIPLLQITDAALKQRIMDLLAPVFEYSEKLMASSYAP
ncbi:MAG: hypothetical protein K1X75_00265 [Leptospirales bacterium]|nr:hypothetical protein [Leptospirales bacterium]